MPEPTPATTPPSGRGRSGPPPRSGVSPNGAARGDRGHRRRPPAAARALADYTTTLDVLRQIPRAFVIGILVSGVALGLLDLIAICTNAVYFHRFGTTLRSPDLAHPGWLAVLIPVAGGVVVGFIARYGSPNIRGHGIPEAMERILINGSRVQPRLAVLKPIASAVSIGTGGPFGAEGPIILTGGAVGSIVGQLFRLTAAQRRALLVAGSAAGMSAVFGTPVAAALFGMELLIFEFKPRSLIPIGVAAATADAVREVFAAHGLVQPQPIFPVPPHPSLAGWALAGAVAVGLATGFGSWVITQAVYGCEDLFRKLTGHVHWMWWPMIGGLAIGLGGLVDPRALGVGYDSIHAELLGRIGLGSLAVLFVVKLAIWSLGLGSGTSGGIFAPILLMGGAIGGVVGHVLHMGSPGTFALLGLTGALSGAIGAPFTGIVFAFELTHDPNVLLPLLITAMTSYLVSVLVLRRSIVTEKVARRGYHVMREYSIDPLEATFVREVMGTEVFTVEAASSIAALYDALPEGAASRRQRLYPVLDASGRLVGVLPWSTVLAGRDRAELTAEDVMSRDFAVAYADDLLRTVADRMTAHGYGVLPVVDHDDPGHLVGLVTQFDLLDARQKLLEEERVAERVLTLRHLRGWRRTS